MFHTEEQEAQLREVAPLAKLFSELAFTYTELHSHFFLYIWRTPFLWTQENLSQTFKKIIMALEFVGILKKKDVVLNMSISIKEK